jgi:hypothetical protein
MMAEINYQYLSTYQTGEPRDQNSGGAICKIKIVSRRRAYPCLECNNIMATNQIHCRSMSYNYIKCSHEQYTTDLHLKIKKIYMYSIHLLEADKA